MIREKKKFIMKTRFRWPFDPLNEYHSVGKMTGNIKWRGKYEGQTTHVCYILFENGHGDRNFTVTMSGFKYNEIDYQDYSWLTEKIVPWVNHVYHRDDLLTRLPPNSPHHPSRNMTEGPAFNIETGRDWKSLSEFDWTDREIFMAYYAQYKKEWRMGVAHYSPERDDFFWVWQDSSEELDQVPVSINHYKIADPWQYRWTDMPMEPSK